MSSGKPIYIDLDNTLGVGIEGPPWEPLVFEVRPDAAWFLGAMSRYGDLHLLSWATKEWIKEAFAKLGAPAKLFKGVISREDLRPVDEQLDVVEETPGLSEEERLELYARVRPIAPPGVAFDDFPVGSRFHRMKTLAVGTFLMGPHVWIQVDSHEPGGPDGGLRRAYAEFQRRNDVWRGRSGRKRVVAAGG